jgi:hypothetical protein
VDAIVKSVYDGYKQQDLVGSVPGYNAIGGVLCKFFIWPNRFRRTHSLIHCTTAYTRCLRPRWIGILLWVCLNFICILILTILFLPLAADNFLRRHRRAISVSIPGLMDIDPTAFPAHSTHWSQSPPPIEDVRMASPPPSHQSALPSAMVGAAYVAPFPNHSASSSTVSQSMQPPQPDVINPFLWVRKATNPRPIPVSPIDGMSITSSAAIVPLSPTAPMPILLADDRYPYSHTISPSAPLVSHWDPSTHACFSRAALVTSIHDSPHTYTAAAKSLA